VTQNDINVKKREKKKARNHCGRLIQSHRCGNYYHLTGVNVGKSNCRTTAPYELYLTKKRGGLRRGKDPWRRLK